MDLGLRNSMLFEDLKIKTIDSEDEFNKFHQFLIFSKSTFLKHISILHNSFKNNLLLSISYNNQYIGFLTWHKHIKRLACIDLFEISESFRRKNIGKFFIQEFLKFLNKKGFVVVELYCAPIESQHFWRRIGFINKSFSTNDGKIELYKIIKENYKQKKDFSIENIKIEDNFKNIIFENDVYIDKENKKLLSPIIINGSKNWHIEWNNGNIVKTESIKYITKEVLYEGDYIIIEKSIF